MIELFTRRLDTIALPSDARLTPLPIEDEISSLSAILLDDEYYNFLKQGCKVVEDINVLDVNHLIPFKAKAYLDLRKRKRDGEQVDEKNIKKHKNDIFRLSELLDVEIRIPISKTIYNDVQEFIKEIKDEDINLKQLNILDKTKKEVLKEISEIYILDKLFDGN